MCIIIRKRLTYFLVEVFKDYDRNIVFETRSRIRWKKIYTGFHYLKQTRNRIINYQSLYEFSNQQNSNFYSNWFYLIGNRMIIWILSKFLTFHRVSQFLEVSFVNN